MRRALYYPHTELREGTLEGERILKRALLLWDKLEYIVPDQDYRPYYQDRRFSAAIEIIGSAHCPTDEEKSIVHQQVEDLVTRPMIPDVFYYHGQPEPYEIYPQKFLEETWKLLQESKMAGQILPRSGDYPLTDQAGLVIMALLADTCAGTTCSRVTDRIQSYGSLTALLANESQDLAQAEVGDRLVTTTLELVDLEKITLDKLIDFRRREETEPSITTLRHRYLARLEDHLNKLRNTSLGSDKVRLEEEFLDDMKRDLSELGSALKLEFKDVVFSKEIVVTLAVLISGGVAALFGGPFVLAGVLGASSVPATIGGVLAARNKYEKARKKIMEDHPMAYLFEMQRGLGL